MISKVFQRQTTDSIRSVLKTAKSVHFSSKIRVGPGKGFVLALGMALLLYPSLSWSKASQVEGVHYQPEGLVIQVSGGKDKPPQVETWPNIKDGVNTELLIIRLPAYECNCDSLQQAIFQEIATHPEVKQLWVGPLNAEKKTGVQIALEVVTPAAKPEFKPELLSQGDDQWIVRLQSITTQNVASQSQTMQSPLSQNVLSASGVDAVSASTVNAQADALNQETGEHKRKWFRQSSSQQTPANTQDLLSSLNQARQRQAELGAQVATLQHSMEESNAQKEALQSRLRGYENLLEETGVNPNDSQHDDKVVIQNLKTALMNVAQKLKAAERELAKVKGDTVSDLQTAPKSESQKVSKPDLSPTAKPVDTPVRNLVENNAETVPPVAVLGTLDLPAPSSVPSKLKSEAANHPHLSQTVYQAKPTAVAMALPKKNTVTELQEALRKNPIAVDNYLSLADYYVSKQDWKNAQSVLQQLTRVEPGGAQGYYYLTMLYLSQNDRKSAQASLEQYAQRNPKDVTGLQTLRKAMSAGRQNVSAFSKMPKAQALPPQKASNTVSGKPLH